MKPADLSRPASAQTILIDLVSTLTAVVDLATLPSAVLLTLKHGLAPVDAGWLALKDPASDQFRPVAAVGCDLPRLRAVAWQPGAALLGCNDAGASCLFTAPSAIQAALAGRNVVRNMRAAQRLLVGFIRAVERAVQKGKIDSTLAIRVLAGAEGMLGQVRASLGVGQGPP